MQKLQVSCQFGLHVILQALTTSVCLCVAGAWMDICRAETDPSFPLSLCLSLSL